MDAIFARFRDLQRYVGWTQDDANRLAAYAPLVRDDLQSWVDDFYEEIGRHEETRRIITGGNDQITRLKQTLHRWLSELFGGTYDEAYAVSRLRVGLRHVEIGLHQVYTNAALSRLRQHLVQHAVAHQEVLSCPLAELLGSITKLLDLDLAIIEDAYEARRMEEETRAERARGERKFQNLVEAATCMIVILRDNQSVAYLSPFGERLTAWPQDKIVGQPFLEIFVPDSSTSAEESQPLRTAWQQAFAQAPAHDCELPIRDAAGNEHWLLWNIRRIDDFEGDAALLAVGHDITEKRRADQRLVQTERLAAIGQTITGLAHESRNALQRIHSCTEMLEFEVDDRPEAMRLIRRSQQAQDDLTRLFDEVRSFASRLSLDRQPCHLAGIWREAWQVLHQERHGRDVILTEELADPDLSLTVDRFRLTQVFRNLFENSLAACSDPVVVKIRCQVLDNPAVVEIQVRDNGPGLSAKARNEVFEPFFTTKPKGTGLGMAIAHRIVEAHGGSIVVGSSSATGAEFILRLPRDAP